MTWIAFIPAVLALLLAPGPTNTLIGLAGAQGGLRGAARMMPAELAGYLTTVLPLAVFGGALVARWPEAAVMLKIAAAIWVMVLAVRLWQPGGKAAPGGVSRRRVYVTTVLNPKALVFGLVLLPGATAPEFPARLAAFCALVLLVATAWGLLGAALRAGLAGGRMMLLQRIAAGWLAFVAITLLGGAITA
ncbi:LysE family translocator [Paenirhodobacter sp.]|uniref:LysE family translocator n=1 Tax=Paenirhodobacter sp. TaxID=1965326 RepID=UPI003B3D70FC